VTKKTVSGTDDTPTIMIVEDEFIIADDIRTSLEKMGYAVCGLAASGLKAVKMAKEKHPDLILMDIMLKGDMDGIEAADIIRKECNINAIFLSAYSDDTILAKAKTTLPYGYLLKPFKDRELKAAIDMAFYRDKMEKERNRLIKELEAALREVKTLKGLLPICSHCKNIRDDSGYWSRLEVYIQNHSEARFSHGICPDCIKTLYGEEGWFDKE
jgi:CheY-like chemotaxis protein